MDVPAGSSLQNPKRFSTVLSGLTVLCPRAEPVGDRRQTTTASLKVEAKIAVFSDFSRERLRTLLIVYVSGTPRAAGNPLSESSRGRGAKTKTKAGL